jgi:hypothetical protein
VSTAIRLPRSYEPGPEVGTWFSIDPQPASISATINIGIVFICAFLVDCGRIICHPAIKMIHKRRTGLAGLVLEQSAGHCSGDQSESAYNGILSVKSSDKVATAKRTRGKA